MTTNTPMPWTERFSVEGKVVLLTGAAGGIGSVFAWALAEAGAVVAAADRSVEMLAPVEELLATDGLTLSPYAADLSDADACEDLVARVHADHGRLDVLVNCAALMARGRIETMEPADFDRVIGVNIRAPYFLSKAAYLRMRDDGGGAIVNIGSVNSDYGLDTVSIYGLTKGAIKQFTQVAAAEFAPGRVRVNCLAPGYFRTQLNAQALWADEKRRAWILDRVLLARAGEPDDLVGALLYLASDASGFVTGQTLHVDGGFLAGGSWDRQGPLNWDEGAAAD
jgi:NAD(P)-dependent dehydrogenase (short-subunit alcohol dehydrogenase family)